MRYRKQHADDKIVDANANPNLEGGDPNLNNEESSYKKRYGDLRRHAQSEKEKLEAQLRELEGKVKEAEKANVKYPKTEEELEAWKNKYPDLGKIFDTMILKHIQSNQGSDDKLDRVKELEKQIEADRLAREEDKAYAKLLEAHSDFETFRDSDEFQTWIGTQSKWVQDVLWENRTDAQAAIDAVDLYKLKTRKSKNDPRDAATNVRRPRNSSPDATGEVTYSESIVNRMSASEYEKAEEKITEQIQNGKFIYDITKAA